MPVKSRKGHTRIDHNLMQSITSFDLTGAEIKALLTIMRFTLGFQQRDQAEIKYRTFKEWTNLSTTGLRKAIRGLENKGVIQVVEKGSTNHSGAKYHLVLDNINWHTGTPQNTSTGTPQDYSTPETLVHHRAPTGTPQNTRTGTLATNKTRRINKVNKYLNKERDARTLVYGQFKNVFLTQEEYDKLVQEKGASKTNDQIENLSLKIESNGYQYDNHYAVLLNWFRADEKQQQASGTSYSGQRKYVPTPGNEPAGAFNNIEFISDEPDEGGQQHAGFKNYTPTPGNQPTGALDGIETIKG